MNNLKFILSAKGGSCLSCFNFLKAPRENLMRRNNKLDEYEKDILSSFENDEWNTVKTLDKEKNHAKETGTNTLQSILNGNLARYNRS